MSDKITYLLWFLILSEEHKLQVFQMKTRSKIFDSDHIKSPTSARLAYGVWT